MLIDWFTVGAQALNFLVLVWLMKRFLYQPVLKAIDAREQHIANTLAAAVEQQTSAQQARDAFQQRNAEFDQQRANQLAQLQAEVAAERTRLLGETRQAADSLRSQQQRALANELQHLHQHIAQRTQQEAFALANQALADLADTTLQAQMVAVFARRLAELDEPARQALARVNPDTALRVRSAFQLSASEQDHIHHALNQVWGQVRGHGGATTDVPLAFSTAPEVLGGLELTANGWKLPWHLADHMAALAQRVDALAHQVGSTASDVANADAATTPTPTPPSAP